jgi:RNA polymerase sigma factor (sigma-70 family)
LNPETLGAPRATNKPTHGRPLAIDRAATELVIRYGSVILADAARHSRTLADAEDAYQRSLEILLTKAPSTDPAELVPWLRVVVRNEAIEIARSRKNNSSRLTERHLEEIDRDELTPEAAAESFADLEMGVDALRHLSGDQLRCLVGQSEGKSYEQIAESTGFSRRKVSRCLARGRAVFAQKLEEIAAGSECARMEPLMHRVFDGDAEAALELRPHLRHCLACRSRLRAYSVAPRSVAALLPPAIVATGQPTRGALVRAVDWLTALADRLAIQLLGAERWVEVSGAKKAVAVATLAAATATGGFAAQSVAERAGSGRPVPALGALATDAADSARMLDRVEPPRAVRTVHRIDHRRVRPVRQAPAAGHGAPAATAAPRVDDGSIEFLPESRGGR